MTSKKNDEERTAIAANKDQRARDAAQATREYEQEKAALLARTEQLREQRLARERQAATDVVPKPGADKKKAARKKNS